MAPLLLSHFSLLPDQAAAGYVSQGARFIISTNPYRSSNLQRQNLVALHAAACNTPARCRSTI
jgi:hypothetical protein